MRGWLGLVFASLLLAGCATAPHGDHDPDPIEPINRMMAHITNAADFVLIGPLADAYVSLMPTPVRQGVDNFFDNAAYLNVILNDVLQGKVEQGVQDSARFAVNTTVGILGIFDPASLLGLEEHNEDLGQTLGVWGAGEGAYLFIPLLGPNSVRDVADIPVGYLTNLVSYADSTVSVPLTFLRIINRRANVASAISMRDQAALDPYLFTREAYRQNREYEIYDGNPPTVGDASDLEADLDAFFDEPVEPR